jgi:hypothetical protein
MDKIFDALGHPLRLWILKYLASNGPTRQTDLAKAIAASGLGPSVANDGATSHLVRPLIEARLVMRDRARGPLRLRYEEQTARLLAIASALAVAIASDSRDAADASHSELIRGLTTAVEEASADKTGVSSVDPRPASSVVPAAR